MNYTWSLFVEGKPDKALAECLFEHLNVQDVEVEMIEGGVSKLGNIANSIRRKHDIGRSIAMILDADCDAQARRNEYQDIVKEHRLHVDRVFFLPDNRSNGCLETLLQQIAISEHSAIYDCFQEYESCLHAHNPSYHLPSLKGRVYAYCDAVSGTKTKRPPKNPVLTACRDASYWNLDAVELKPLKEFLVSM